MIVNAEFRQQKDIPAAIEALKEQGFGPDQIDVFSKEPIELEPGVLDRPSRMSLFAVIGGIAIGGLATAFVYYTQLDYPLVTGGMPVSGWATGVITYEFTMVGAILATVFMFLWESRLFRHAPPRPVLEPPDKGAVVQVQSPSAWAGRAAEALRQFGASEVKTLEGSS